MPDRIRQLLDDDILSADLADASLDDVGTISRMLGRSVRVRVATVVAAYLLKPQACQPLIVWLLGQLGLEIRTADAASRPGELLDGYAELVLLAAQLNYAGVRSLKDWAVVKAEAEEKLAIIDQIRTWLDGLEAKLRPVASGKVGPIVEPRGAAR